MTFIFITILISFTIISLPSYQKLCMKSLFFIRDYFIITNYIWYLLRFTLYTSEINSAYFYMFFII